MGKDKTSTVKIKCLEHTARNFTNFLRQENTIVRNTPTKKEIENFWKEVFGKKA
jgi:hypothetical protein